MPSPAAPLALMMSGGGARAAYQVGVLRALARRWPDFQPQIITGVSAGAINAASLAGYAGPFIDALDDLGRLWGGLTTEQVFRTDSSSLLQIGYRWAKRLLSGGEAGRLARGLVDTAPLRDLLGHYLDPNGDGLEGVEANIRAGRLHAFGITATNYATGRSVTWVQGREVQSWDFPEAAQHPYPRRGGARDGVGGAPSHLSGHPRRLGLVRRRGDPAERPALARPPPRRPPHPRRLDALRPDGGRSGGAGRDGLPAARADPRRPDERHLSRPPRSGCHHAAPDQPPRRRAR